VDGVPKIFCQIVEQRLGRRVNRHEIARRVVRFPFGACQLQQCCIGNHFEGTTRLDDDRHDGAQDIVGDCGIGRQTNFKSGSAIDVVPIGPHLDKNALRSFAPAVSGEVGDKRSETVGQRVCGAFWF
jgi:hypothetical protein